MMLLVVEQHHHRRQLNQWQQHDDTGRGGGGEQAKARIQSTERNCSWHWNCWEKCVSKATYYCRILIDIDFCSIIKFQLMHTMPDGCRTNTELN